MAVIPRTRYCRAYGSKPKTVIEGGAVPGSRTRDAGAGRGRALAAAGSAPNTFLRDLGEASAPLVKTRGKRARTTPQGLDVRLKQLTQMTPQQGRRTGRTGGPGATAMRRAAHVLRPRDF